MAKLAAAAVPFAYSPVPRQELPARLTKRPSSEAIAAQTMQWHISVRTIATMESSLTAGEGYLLSGGAHGRRRHRLRNGFIAILVCCIVFLAAWVIAGNFLFANPAVDQPTESDAIIVLAPAAETGRLDHALDLMSEGYSSTLVISAPPDNEGSICGADRPYRIICFSPDPVTTQGEARAIQKLSEENGWRTITVVTDDSHVTRARILIARCYSQELNMSASKRELSPSSWAFRFLYESAALVPVALHPSC